MKKNYKLKLTLLFTLGLFVSTSWGQTTYNYTGAEQSYVVPVGITSIQIESKGSKGENGTSGGIGGNGATMIGAFSVTPGEILTVYPGGNPVGLQSGGDGSYVVNAGGTLLIVAGGGGAGGWNAFGGEAPISNDGLAPPIHTGGAGGTGGNGGAQGVGSWGTGGGGGWLTAGGNGLGSVGGLAPCRASLGTTYAGGAGGGYSGGGGVEMFGGAGTGGAGAGGSYNIGTDQSNTAGNNSGLGQIIVTELCSPITVTVSDSEICLGESFTLEASGEGVITWDGGVINGEAFTPDSPGTITYTTTSDDATECIVMVEILINDLPIVIATVDNAEICDGDSVIFSATGADEYLWEPGDIESGEYYTPTEAIAYYVVTGADLETNCMNSDSVEVIVNENPTITANVDDDLICFGDEIILTGSGGVSYDWNFGAEDGVGHTPEDVGTFTYMVTGTDDNGCSNEGFVIVTVYSPIEITYTSTDEISGSDGEIDITVTGGSPGYTFDWDNDGTGDFDDTEDLTELVAGTYTVVVQCEAGCLVSESITVDSQVGMSEFDEIAVTVYPNPTSGLVTIVANGSFVYDLIDLNGKVIKTNNGVDSIVLDLSKYERGIYFVQIKSENQTNTVKLIRK